MSRSWVTVARAAEVLGVKPRQVTRLLRAGQLAGWKARGDREWRIDRTSLEARADCAVADEAELEALAELESRVTGHIADMARTNSRALRDLRAEVAALRAEVAALKAG